MESREEKIQELKEEGYNPVQVYNAEPKEEDLEHAHAFDTHLVILDGEIKIKMDGNNVELKAGDEIDIPRGKIHYSLTGENGCELILAERH